ncbi:micrococcal nuclease [Kineosphaera limosa]|uniref:Putative nuclease n=1 Tax=Kineosphaera limosa NBRC 100340 TaxID=1184609 RepID=K6WB16_9MICO|nr:thermonuclease family protein [Kineosphaera limosa]NYE00808.1 micrococcal nuclease [Kineosphaera limosa]GAB96420.1 putative nuclease [Kineosphaera limosa NBRC 100340]
MTRLRFRAVGALVAPMMAAATLLTSAGAVPAAAASPMLSPIAATAPKGVPVSKIVDGDTLQVRISGRTETVRVIGMDAPEKGECFSAESARAMSALVKGKQVRLVADRSQPDRDRHKRLLRHVVLADGRRVAPLLIAGGNGWEFTYGKAYDGRAAHRAAESKAIKAKAGMWGGCPDLTRKITIKGKCAIKGNINSKREKIYHLPGGRDYGKTTIDTRKGERWFCTQVQARQAGWRAAKV